MSRKPWGRPHVRVKTARIAGLLALLTLILSGCSAQQWERNLRFGWPTGVTKQATRMRVLWTWTGVTALALGVVVWSLIFWACIRYRKRSDELPRQTKYNFAVEMVCFTFPFIVIAGLFYRTVVVEDYVNKLTKNPDVVVQVDAFKWNWQFEYLSYRDAAGVKHTTTYPGQQSLASNAGSTDSSSTTAPTANCDEASSNDSYSCGASGKAKSGASGALYLSTVGSQDEIPVLVIPENRTVRFVEHSEDVIHSFWVPEFLFKRDVIPYGTSNTTRDNQFEITATKTGNFVGRCAELCGTYHSEMNFEVRVVPMQTYTTYLAALKQIGPTDPARQSKALSAAGMAPYATSTHPFNTDNTYRGPSKSGQEANN